MKKLKSSPECVVRGALAITLFISCWTGVAPLSFKKERTGWRIRVSPTMYVYSCILILGINASLLAGFILDMSLEPTRGLRTRSASARASYLFEVLTVPLVAIIGVFGAPGRMKSLILSLNIIEKINSKINNSYTKLDVKRCVLVVMTLTAITMLSTADFYSYASMSILKGREVMVIYFYFFFYLEFFITVLLNMQFAVVALIINSTLGYVNEMLKDITKIIDMQSKPGLYHLISTEEETVPIPGSLVKFVQTKPDSHTQYNPGPQSSKRIIGTIRRLIISYGAICDVVRQVNDNNGRVLMASLAAMFFHLLVTPYNYVVHYFNPDKKNSVVMQTFYATFHFCNLVLVVEPGHRTIAEFDKTQILISQLLRRVSSPEDTLALELELFLKQISLNQVAYTPMGICTFTRSLIISIITGVTTYLVVILQFQTLNNQMWMG